jgi:16S rRNA (uracil1498-N3)-methyltransferase
VRRCPVPAELFGGEGFALDEALTRYLCVVLRLSEGATFVGFNGEGAERRYLLERPEEGQWWASALEPPREGRSGAPLTLCYGVPKGDKLDLVARQLTELGVGGLALWAAERSVSVWRKEKAQSKLARLEKVVAEAARQCGRADTLTLTPPASLTALIERFESAPLKLYLDPRAPLTLTALSSELGAGEERVEERVEEQVEEAWGEVVALVGPEGGLSAQEIEALEGAGWRGLAFTSPVLRTETAATVTCALLLERMGWL